PTYLTTRSQKTHMAAWPRNLQHRPSPPSRCPSHSVMKGHICRIQCSGLPSVLCRLLCGAGLPIKRQYVTVRINCVGSAKKMGLYPRTGLNEPNRESDERAGRTTRESERP